MTKTIKSKKKTYYTLSFCKLNSSGLELYEFEKILRKKATGHGIGMGKEDIWFKYDTSKTATNAFLRVSKYRDIVDIVLEKKRE